MDAMSSVAVTPTASAIASIFFFAALASANAPSGGPSSAMITAAIVLTHAKRVVA
jgi:hypothetical protein